MMIQVVPMNPEYLPELGLLIAGGFAAGVAIHSLATRRFRRSLLAAAAGLACLALTFVSAKTLHRPPGPPVLRPATESSMSLVLGDVTLRVAPAKQYLLSVDDRQFLQLDLRRSGLAVSCVAGAHGRAATGIDRNTFPYKWADVRPSSPDAHTLLVRDDGEEIFRARYAEPRRIEVAGQFFQRHSAEKVLISFQDGIAWEGGRVPPGAVIDLTSQGRGRIDFGRSGVIRVRHED